MFRRETYDNKGNVIELIERPFTPKELLVNWEVEMQATDLSDDLENIMDALSVTVRDKIAPETLNKYNAKKLLRAEKPS
ncbi:MAG: hypothetical protein ACUZ8E_17395 [Candidatus Anammoxibacter sp.]